MAGESRVNDGRLAGELDAAETGRREAAKRGRSLGTTGRPAICGFMSGDIEWARGFKSAEGQPWRLEGELPSEGRRVCDGGRPGRGGTIRPFGLKQGDTAKRMLRMRLSLCMAVAVELLAGYGETAGGEPDGPRRDPIIRRAGTREQ